MDRRLPRPVDALHNALIPYGKVWCIVSWRRPRFTIRALMIVTVVVAVALAVVVTLSRSRLLPTRGLLLFGPALLFLVHRVILLGLVRREEREREQEQESEWPRRW